MLVDSHCHLNCIDLSSFDNNPDRLMAAAAEAGLEHLLTVCVELADFEVLCTWAHRYPQVSISVGVHPASDVMANEPSAEKLAELAAHPRCIALGETGLDYYHIKTPEAQEQQRARFATHIQAARLANKPLIVHTREAIEDTLAVMRAENAATMGGVMHCFSESIEAAEQAMAMNFYISISGIITFKNAQNLRELVKHIPLDRVLIETDSPYLAPMPFRGKMNHPALVKYVALALSDLYQISFEEFAQQTTNNFYQCFKVSR